jgi:hypothetical protein
VRSVAVWRFTSTPARWRPGGGGGCGGGGWRVGCQQFRPMCRVVRQWRLGRHVSRSLRRVGGGLLLLAAALFAAGVAYPFWLGGKVLGGKVEGGRYFVASAGHRYAEVSEAQWRTEQHLECGILLPVMLVWIGLAFRDGPGVPSKLTAFVGIVGVAGAVVTAAMGWVVTGAPWTPVLGAWLVLWVGCLAIACFSDRPSPAPAE